MNCFLLGYPQGERAAVNGTAATRQNNLLYFGHGICAGCDSLDLGNMSCGQSNGLNLIDLQSVIDEEFCKRRWDIAWRCLVTAAGEAIANLGCGCDPSIVSNTSCERTHSNARWVDSSQNIVKDSGVGRWGKRSHGDFHLRSIAQIVVECGRPKSSRDAVET